MDRSGCSGRGGHGGCTSTVAAIGLVDSGERDAHTVVRADRDGAGYLVSLSGGSEWVRNVRAAAGRVVLGRWRRCAAVLVEVPAAERPAVIRAHLGWAGRRERSRGAANEARYYFGVAADPSVQELVTVADRYPVFRIGSPWSAGRQRPCRRRAAAVPSNRARWPWRSTH